MICSSYYFLYFISFAFLHFFFILSPFLFYVYLLCQCKCARELLYFHRLYRIDKNEWEINCFMWSNIVFCWKIRYFFFFLFASLLLDVTSVQRFSWICFWCNLLVVESDRYIIISLPHFFLLFFVKWQLDIRNCLSKSTWNHHDEFAHTSFNRYFIFIKLRFRI